jgi:hypothetical protein
LNTFIIDNFINDVHFSKEFYEYIQKGELKTSFNNIASPGKPIDGFTSSLSQKNFHIPFIYDLYKKVNELHEQHFQGANSQVARWHLNLHPTGYDGHHHTDYDTEDLPTYLYMSTVNWNPQWGGEFLVYDENSEIKEAYSYRTDRLIVFNGRFLHRGVAALRVSNLLRTTVAFQCKLYDKEKTTND